MFGKKGHYMLAVDTDYRIGDFFSALWVKFGGHRSLTEGHLHMMFLDEVYGSSRGGPDIGAESDGKSKS